MDPDAIFIILLFFVLLILTIGNLFGLSRKIWASAIPVFLKVIAMGLLLTFLIIGITKFDTVDNGEEYIGTAQIIILCASFIIALNWSINISKRISKLKPYITIPALTVVFSFLIPFTLYYLGNFFDDLNLMGSGG